MSSVTLSRAAAFALLLGTVALAPAFAAPVDPTAPAGPPNSTVTMDANGNLTNATPDNGMMMQQPAAPAMQGHAMHHGMMAAHHSPEAMQAHVEERIKTLHAKLMITSDQESQWSDVAQAMRDSEASTSGLIQERQENSANMTAVDDLTSYQKIAQSHADGLAKVASAFSTLYNNMSPAQKRNADKVFGGYEGHGPMGAKAKKAK